MLLFGGAMQLAGEVCAKANRRRTRSDWMGIERRRRKCPKSPRRRRCLNARRREEAG